MNYKKDEEVNSNNHIFDAYKAFQPPKPLVSQKNSSKNQKHDFNRQNMEQHKNILINNDEQIRIINNSAGGTRVLPYQ